MTVTALRPVPDPERPATAARLESAQAMMASAHREAQLIALEALSFASEAQHRLEALSALAASLPVTVAHDAPILARQMELALERMATSMRNGGRVRG